MSETGRLALPTIIESDSCKDLEILLDDASIASVLPSLNFSLLIVINDLTSSIHDDELKQFTCLLYGGSTIHNINKLCFEKVP